MTLPSVAAVIVAYSDPEGVQQAIAALRRQSRPLAEIIVVDNHPEQLTAPLLDGEPDLTVITNPANTGYAGGNGLGAAAAHSDYLLFINPDAQADPELCAHLAAELDADPAVAIAGAQILLPDGRCNAGDNPLHITGLSWSGRLEQPRERGPARDAPNVSGACLMVRATTFKALRGFNHPYFLYCEDTDLSWRARLLGHRVRFVPEATVFHDYEFSKGTAKWRYLERNRLLMVLANYETGTLLALAPVLAVTELALWAAAWRGGWAAQKLQSYRDLAAMRGWLRGQRRRVQRSRVLGDEAVLDQMTGTLTSSPLMDGAVARAASLVYEFWRVLLLRRKA